ncbi:hypothetical protein ACRJ4W_35405 [Streptomyces sp. GLT-R25]
MHIAIRRAAGLTGLVFTATLLPAAPVAATQAPAPAEAKERVYNHAAVVVGNNGRDLQLRQHGGVSKTTLSAAIARYRNKANYIERVVILRPKSRS